MLPSQDHCCTVPTDCCLHLAQPAALHTACLWSPISSWPEQKPCVKQDEDLHRLWMLADSWQQRQTGTYSIAPLLEEEFGAAPSAELWCAPCVWLPHAGWAAECRASWARCAPTNLVGCPGLSMPGYWFPLARPPVVLKCACSSPVLQLTGLLLRRSLATDTVCM